MEALDKLRIRDQQRLNPNILDPVKVNNINDIKKLLVELDPNRSKTFSDIPVSVSIESEGKTYDVGTTTKSRTKREILIEGFDIIRKRLNISQESEMNINGRIVKFNLLNPMECQNWIDPLIKQWFGGHRDGLYICWKIGDDTYKYDIYEHKLFGVKK